MARDAAQVRTAIAMKNETEGAVGYEFRRLLRSALALLLLLAWGGIATATEALVVRNVNLRPDPSSSQPSIRLLRPPDHVELISPEPSGDFYHVRTAEDEEGWVWRRNVRILPEEGEGASPGTTAANVGSAISEGWDKPAPNHSSFSSDGKTCGAFGDAAGNQTNLRKNRTDIPSAYHDVTVAAIRDLPFPNVPKSRENWTAEQSAEIAKSEGVAVRVVGYLVAIKPQGGSGESTNCHWTKPAQTDWHIALVEHPGDGEADSVVVETTPRIRQNHGKWTVGRLDNWLDSDNPVRISGWLLFDPEHRNHLGKYRHTLWEIHPITKIEVMKEDQWISLDDIP
jgi:hypothetical protein